LFKNDRHLTRGLYGKVDRIGLSGTNLTYFDPNTQLTTHISIKNGNYQSAENFLMDWLVAQRVFSTISAVGHRLVHGMKHTLPTKVTKELIDELYLISPFDPEHMPNEISLIETVKQRHPNLLQIVCFDTTFHTEMPRVAKQIALPRHYESKGIQRYGFHGLSYTFLLEALNEFGDPAAQNGRVILAHLGNGASMAAVSNGKSIDTSMSFTPTSGLVMSTRSGDLDPGLFGYLSKTTNMTLKQFYSMVNHESGLLGISETSPDIRDLLELESTDLRAAEAIAIFCYQAKKMIGAYAAALGGLDTLVFSGGIGENSPVIRERICQGLNFLGISIEAESNASNAKLISTHESQVKIHVIHSDEELVIAQYVKHLIDSATQ
jgi:acetate kinase